ncbi:GH92 family glycosyl hydrolase, partial [Phyllobacterium bourgognense]
QLALDAANKLGASATDDFKTRISALEAAVEKLKFEPQLLADYVNTTRGSINHDYASDGVARGNTFPATAMPFGFNMWTPVNKSNRDWFYDVTSNSMQGFAVTHEASGHNGNHQALKFMPVGDETRVSAGEPFERKDEIAKAHYYGVTFKNGMKTEITPTHHAAYVRFTAPAAFTKTTIAFDQFVGNGLQKIDKEKGTISGETHHQHDVHTPKLYFFVRFDSPITNFKNTSSSVAKGWVQFDTPTDNKVVGMRMATSFISEAQAEENLNQEIPAAKNFDDVLELAQAAWNERLNTIQVDGATEDQKIILYSNMYRAFLYPNSAWEKVKGADGRYEAKYSSPYTDDDKIKKGKIWVGNGFWDTYRTTWPLYTLLNPNEAGEMLDGFVNGYKDGGWTTRWSNPGYRDSMVATSLDVILADAYMKGVRNFDVDAAYKSMLRNATAYSYQNDRGRKGMDQMPFYGHKPGGGEAVAWSLEAYLNDFGISEIAKALGKTDDAAYLANRAISYPNIFDSTSTGTWADGWFRTKYTNGNWDTGPSSPQTWGYGYTEGNAWSYAFLAPQDGQGLANLYGGRDKLKIKLDKFFATRPGSDGGSYGMIHEVREALEVYNKAPLLGEYQHSNQTVHHSIYMYNYAGAPSGTQNLVREVMDKLYFTGFDKSGVSNGEGYIGDEDNGEQSAWYVLSAMGFYPVSMGRPEYAIGAPYFPKMTIGLRDADGVTNRLNIKAPNVNAANRYVQAVRLNGMAVTRNYLLHMEIAKGGTLEFDMGPNPSQWGTGENDVPTSITKPGVKPSPLQSLLPQGNYDVTSTPAANSVRIFDRTSGTEWASDTGAPTINVALKASKAATPVSIYTLTDGSDVTKSPKSWTFKGSNDGITWVELDKRENQTFLWPRQTRPFVLKNPATYKQYRLELGTGAVTIAEFELLGNAPQ